tara:strand:+ start:33112 stop:33678 length:567 start_codon:yes stop_codon:yes gene_type:complete
MIPPDAESSATDDEVAEAWYCLRSQTKKEHLAAAQIRHRVGIEVFAPRITFTKKTKRGKVRFTEALFPGYLFCRCNIQEHMRHLLSMPGIINIVRYGDRTPPIPDEFMAELKERIPSEKHESSDPIIEVGAPVTVVEGPFKDLQAVVSQVLSARDRVRILLEFLGRQAEIEVPSHAVFREDKTPKEGF